MPNLLKWDIEGERYYETGVDRGVLYRKNSSGSEYENGVVWNGLTSVSQSPSGAEETKLYADNVKYLSLYSAEEFGGTIEAYTYPDEWAVCDGSAYLDDAGAVYIGQQTRRGFGFSYRTKKGNDQNPDLGYLIHIVYNAKASPSERSYATVNDSPEAITFSWEFTTTPVSFGEDFKPSAMLIIDTTKLDPSVLTEIEEKLYGKAGSDGTKISDAELPSPEWIIAKVASAPTYVAVSKTGTGYSSKNPSTEGWYERSGVSEPYTYTLSADTEVDQEKTYYELSS